MTKSKICHWFLWKNADDVRSIFAPYSEKFEGFRRVGEAVHSEQFVLPLIFAVESDLSNSPEKCSDQVLRMQLAFERDECGEGKRAFENMQTLKIATLVSELSASIAEFVSAIGIDFNYLKINNHSDVIMELGVLIKDARTAESIRAEVLLKSGIAMMAYARGLRLCDQKN